MVCVGEHSHKNTSAQTHVKWKPGRWVSSNLNEKVSYMIEDLWTRNYFLIAPEDVQTQRLPMAYVPLSVAVMVQPRIFQPT